MIHDAPNRRPSAAPRIARNPKEAQKWAKANRRVVVLSRLAGLADAGGLARCSGGTLPIPMDCFDQSGVLRTTAEANQQWNLLWNADATQQHDIAYNNWVLNDGRRWVNNQWVQTAEPPPPAPQRSTDIDKLMFYQSTGTPDPAGNYQQLPYYVGGGITTLAAPNQVVLASGAGPVSYGSQAASPLLYPAYSYPGAPDPSAPIPAKIPYNPPAPANVAAPAPAPAYAAPAPAPAYAAPTPVYNTTPPADRTPDLPAPNLLPPSGGAGFGSTIRQPTGSILPAQVASALPSWLSELPLWQAAAAAAAIYYYATNKPKGRR